MTWSAGHSYGPEFFRNRAIVRKRVAKAGGYCERPGCRNPYHQTDHIIPKAEGGSDSLDNLEGVCKPHHDEKTAQEAARGRFRRSGKRPPRQHPGRVQ